MDKHLYTFGLGFYDLFLSNWKRRSVLACWVGVHAAALMYYGVIL